MSAAEGGNEPPVLDAADLDLPGADLVSQGLDDLFRGIESGPALLVSIGAPRLRRMGLAVPGSNSAIDPELRLYRLLCRQEGQGAYSRYNSLLRRLISFERALEQRRARRS